MTNLVSFGNSIAFSSSVGVSLSIDACSILVSISSLDSILLSLWNCFIVMCFLCLMFTKVHNYLFRINLNYQYLKNYFIYIDE